MAFPVLLECKVVANMEILAVDTVQHQLGADYTFCYLYALELPAEFPMARIP